MLSLFKPSSIYYSSFSPFMFSSLVKFKVIEDNKTKEISAQIGNTLLEVAKQNNIGLIGACEGSCACASCHVILDKNIFEKIPKPSESEEDMLELAFGLTSTSRLACQIKIDKNFENAIVTIPKVQRNISLDELSVSQKDGENKKI